MSLTELDSRAKVFPLQNSQDLPEIHYSKKQSYPSIRKKLLFVNKKSKASKTDFAFLIYCHNMLIFLPAIL